MKIVVAPDSFGGTLSARESANAIARGWQQARPADIVVEVPLSDGGEGFLDVVSSRTADERFSEVSAPLGNPRRARWALSPDGTAFIESAEACGLHLVPETQRNPELGTTYGVGQLLNAAREAGATRIVVGLGGSATVDGGAGALTALGMRFLTRDGSGVKVGGGHLGSITAIDAAHLDRAWNGLVIELWTDVLTPIADAANRFGPQKGATPESVGRLAEGLAKLVGVLGTHFDAHELAQAPGTGSAGGLAYGLAIVLGAEIHAGAAAVAAHVALQDDLDGADLVVSGEGRLDATTSEGKVVHHVAAVAQERGIPLALVVGEASTWSEGAIAIEEARDRENAASGVEAAARRLAAGIGTQERALS